MAAKNNSVLTRRRSIDLVRRWEGNPLIDINDLSFQCSDIHNATAVGLRNEILLLVTIEQLSGSRSIHLAWPTADGYYDLQRQPFLGPSSEQEYKQHESAGVMDARVTFLEGVYYIMYTALGDHGFRLALAGTQDFRSVQRMGLISEPDTKAGVLFPAKINGQYARLERPREGGSIWVTYSEDLLHWGRSELVISPREGFWDASRIGPAATPIEIDQGWLVLYYGVRETSAGPIYRAGTVILDRHQPTQIVGRANIPILSPREDYERLGDVPNLVFPTGALADDNGNVKIFYGAANSCICMGTACIEEIVANCVHSEEEY